MQLIGSRLLLLIFVVGCRGPAGDPNPPRRAAAGDTPFERSRRALSKVERRLRRHPGDLAAWKRLRRLAQQTQRRYRELLTLQRVHARERLPSALRPRLSALLRRRAEELWQLGAPAAAQAALKRARALQRHPSDRWESLRDRLTLALADRALGRDRPARALKAYRRLARRGVLAGDALSWRQAAAGHSKSLPAQAAGIRRLAREAPAIASRLARQYLDRGGKSPTVLLAALRASGSAPKVLADRIDRQLSKVAPAGILSKACALRRRPTSSSCRTLEGWATTDLTALRFWAALCRRLHWVAQNASWIARVQLLLRTRGLLGLGPMEGLTTGLAAWKRPGAGQPPSKRSAPCTLIRVTRLLRGHRAAWSLTTSLVGADAQLRSRLVEGMLHQGALPAALHLAAGAGRKQAEAALRRFGRRLAKWGVQGHAGLLRKGWQQRYGSSIAKAAWTWVEQGAQHRRTETPVHKLARLAGMGRYDAALAQAGRLREVSARQLWRARLHVLRGKPAYARRALLTLRESSAGGARQLVVVMEELIRLGLSKTAMQLADALYERSPQDPALLRIVALAQLAGGRLDKARLALVDWAAVSPRPELPYLAAGRLLAARDRPTHAAVLTSRALPWSGHRPLQVGLPLLGYQLTARRNPEAQKTAAWLLGQWPKGRGRSGISQTLAAHLLSQGQLGAAQQYLLLERGTQLPALFRKGRFREVVRRAGLLSNGEPLAGRWPAVAALAELRLKNRKRAAQRMREASRRTPRLEPLLDALTLADRGRIGPALVSLALALTGADPTDAPALQNLAATLASRAGDRRRAAGLLADVLTAQAWGTDRTGWIRLRQLTRGRRLPPARPWAILLAAHSDRSCSH